MKYKCLIICFTIIIICLFLSACQVSKVPTPVAIGNPTIQLATPLKTAQVETITPTLADTDTPTSTPTLIPSTYSNAYANCY